jgi:hypothetical protein
VACLGAAARGGDDAPPAEVLDLTRAVVVAPEGLSGPERKAVAMLVDEVARRSQIRWEVRPTRPDDPETAAILIGRAEAEGRPAEGFAIRVEGRRVSIAGNDPRGVLFGVGRLLRELRMARGRILLPAGFQVATAPRYPLRGHQLGYRPKTNSYDAWDLDRWEQYYRDLVVFGCNAVELIPPRSDDDADSPHFPRPPMEMMVGMSRLADEYGLDVWIWYPAMDDDYADPATVEFAIKEWGEVFASLPRIDAVFVPGGDPGHTRPRHLMALLEKQAQSLRRHHPKAQMWVSPQSFTQEWLDEFLSLVHDEPDWLAGIVFGPQVRIGLAELREAIPSRYPIRLYPDITHSLGCQYPVPDWDQALAITEAREVINPRPHDQAAIFRATKDHAIGFLTYSEGCNDDVNKMLWSSLGWDPDADVTDLLRQYARYFIGDGYAEGFAQGLLALERNWRGPLRTNAGVETTLRQFQAMERSATPDVLLNWRFQQALYRAYYDAHVRDRLIHETGLESKAREALRRAGQTGSLPAMDEAEAILEQAVTRPVSADRRARVFELGEALFQSARMQLSVPKYQAIEVWRGANLDTIDLPLNDRTWLESRFAEIRQLASEPDRLKAIASLLDRADPGPGGFYDDLGDPADQPHLVRGPGYSEDPDFRRSPMIGSIARAGWPLAASNFEQILFETPLELRYEGLDPSARYRVRVAYAGDPAKVRVRLDADGRPVHPPIEKPDPLHPVEAPVPAETTSDGSLTLRWTQDPGRGGNGRGCPVAEVWLIREGP